MEIPENFVLTSDMKKIIKDIKNKNNVFITGTAGTGKSTFLEYLKQEIFSSEPVVVAPTGVAALNVNGMTIHKFFSFPIHVTLDLIHEEYYPKYREVMKKLKVLVIDEISMVRADLLDCVDLALRKFGPSKTKPFGGVQLIFIGDLLQLSPILKGDEKEYIEENYDTPYFFSSNAYKKIRFKSYELSDVFRQKQKKFIQILNSIRVDEAEEKYFDELNKRFKKSFKPPKGKLFITLTVTNQAADNINNSRLKGIRKKSYEFIAQIIGKVDKDEYPTSDELLLKQGAQVMMVSNDPEGRWVNGSLGIVDEIVEASDQTFLRVLLEKDKNPVSVFPEVWEIKRPKLIEGKLTHEVVGSFKQFPLRLAWAITIHKSQGKTFENVAIDLSPRVFAEGQLYVALSRCTTIDGIVLLTKVNNHQVIVDPNVLEYLESQNLLSSGD